MALKAVVPNLDDVPEQFHELYTERNGQFELTGVEGMRTEADVQRLQTSLTKERDAHKATKQRFEPFTQLGNIDEVRSQLDRIPELEALAEGKVDDSKINSIVETRIRTRLAPVERERDQLKGQVAERDKTIQGFETKERSRTITDAVKTAAKKAGIQDSAVEDAILLAERVFELDESGSVLTKDGVGATPGVDPTVWFTEMQAKRPHWWGASVGGGANGNRGNGSTPSTNPFTAENWNMTEQGRLVRENRSRAEQLAKAAGTSIGGPKPKPRSGK